MNRPKILNENYAFPIDPPTLHPCGDGYYFDRQKPAHAIRHNTIGTDIVQIRHTLSWSYGYIVNQ